MDYYHTPLEMVGHWRYRSRSRIGELRKPEIIPSKMITVTAPLQLWTGDSGSWHMFIIPEEQSGQIRAHAFATPRGFKSVRVHANINGISWRTSVFPMRSGGYLLPVKAVVRRDAGIAAGDEVTIELELL